MFGVGYWGASYWGASYWGTAAVAPAYRTIGRALVGRARDTPALTAILTGGIYLGLPPDRKGVTDETRIYPVASVYGPTARVPTLNTTGIGWFSFKYQVTFWARDPAEIEDALLAWDDAFNPSMTPLRVNRYPELVVVSGDGRGRQLPSEVRGRPLHDFILDIDIQSNRSP